MVASGLREVPVVSKEGHLLGLLDESDVAEAYLRRLFVPNPPTAKGRTPACRPLI